MELCSNPSSLTVPITIGVGGPFWIILVFGRPESSFFLSLPRRSTVLWLLDRSLWNMYKQVTVLFLKFWEAFEEVNARIWELARWSSRNVQPPLFGTTTSARDQAWIGREEHPTLDFLLSVQFRGLKLFSAIRLTKGAEAIAEEPLGCRVLLRYIFTDQAPPTEVCLSIVLHKPWIRSSSNSQTSGTSYGFLR